MVHSLDCYSYRLIGKLTAFFLRLCNLPVDSSTSTVTFSLQLKAKVGTTLAKTAGLRVNLN